MRDQIEATSSLPALWTNAPLRELCSFHNGLWKGKKAPFETVHVIRNTNFTAGGRIDLTDVAVLEVEAKQFAKRRLLKNDIIIEKSGGGPKQPVGRVVLFDLDSGNYSFSNFTSAIRVEDVQRIDPIFLHRVLYYWYLSGQTEPLQRHSTGIRNLDFDNYKELHVPLPPLEEQKRIVAVLDQAFAALDRARADAEANLLDLDDLMLAASRKTFDALEAEWRSLGSLCEIYQPKTISAKEMSPGGQYVVFGANGKIGRYHAYNHAEPQLLVTCRGATCGQINISEPFSWITGNAMVVRPKGLEITSDFLEHFFRDAVDWDEVITGAAQPQITRQSLSPMMIPVPALTEQDAASEKLGALRDQVETLRSEYQTKLGQLADLRKSLLQQAFAGRLT